MTTDTDPPANLSALLTETDASPDAPLVYWRDQEFSRGDIAEAAEFLAGQLRRAGVGEGNAVSAMSR